jgi:hypothetical protein
MRGEYFTWLAHDDMYYPCKLEKQIALLRGAWEETAIVHGDYDLLNVRDGTVSRMRQEDSYSAAQITNAVFPLLTATLHASTPLIHKSHFARVGLFDEGLPLTQDYDFLFRAMRGRRTLFLPEPLLLSRLHAQSGKNTADRFGLACSEQYRHFADTLTYAEIRAMFVSPRAFYCRMAAIMKARADTPEADAMFARIAKLPAERDDGGAKLRARLADLSGGDRRAICIFGAGYHGRVLKCELEHRGIPAACFCDNDPRKHGTVIRGLRCAPPAEVERAKDDTLVLIAADVSDAIEAQLAARGFPFTATKKSLDALLLACPPIV